MIVCSSEIGDNGDDHKMFSKLTGILFKHIKTGGVYRVISDKGRTVGDNSVKVVIYRRVDSRGYLDKKDPRIWVRPLDQFTDDRFSKITIGE